MVGLVESHIQRVLQKHGHGHLAYATGNGRKCCDFVFAVLEIHIAYGFPVDVMHTHVDNNGILIKIAVD